MNGNRIPMSKNRFWSYLPFLLFALLIGAATLLVVSASPSRLMNWYNNDDGFFYFKVAQNIVAGKGVTFDGINPTNGFHPLWMLICIPVFLIKNDLILPLRIVVGIFGILQFISAAALFDVLQKATNRWIGFFLTVSFILCWQVYSTTFTGGLESALSFMFMILTWRQAILLRENPLPAKRDYIFAGILAGMTILSRLDNFIFIGFLSVWLLFKRRRDAAILLLDMLFALMLIVFTMVKLIGYRIHPYALFTFLTLAGLLGTGIAAFFAFGLYSLQPKWLKIKSVYLRGLAAGVISGIVPVLIVLFLARTGLLERYSRSVILTVATGWAVYSATIRSWLADRLIIHSDEAKYSAAEQWQLCKQWLASAWLYALPVVVLVGAYMVWSQVNFGTPMPVSGQIKQWWGSLGATVYGSPIQSLANLRRYIWGEDSPFQLLYAIFLSVVQSSQTPPYTTSIASWVIVAAIYALLAILPRQRAGFFAGMDSYGLFPLLLAAVYRVTYFYASGYVHMRSWYWTVETFFVFILLLIPLLSLIRSGLQYRAGKVISVIATGLAALAVVITISGSLFKPFPIGASDEDPGTYLIIPEIVESITPPGAVIGTPGGGSFSYFIKDRTVVNLDGLMNSKAYFQALRKGDTHSIMQAANIQYIYANGYTLLETQPYMKVFTGCVTEIAPVLKKQLYSYHCQ